LEEQGQGNCFNVKEREEGSGTGMTIGWTIKRMGKKCWRKKERF
jgi:hypothetical protein